MNLKKLSPRHRLLAMQVANGVPVRQAAQQLGFSEGWALAVSRAPLFLSAVDTLLSKRERNMLAEAKKRLADEALNNVEAMVEVRDTAEDPRTRLAAAEGMLDYVVPRKTATEEERTFKFVLSDDQYATIKQALSLLTTEETHALLTSEAARAEAIEAEFSDA
jgi:hypothetical protein